MSSGTQVDLDWAGIDPPSPEGGFGGQAPPTAGGANIVGTGEGVRDAAYLTDEEILGIEPVGLRAEIGNRSIEVDREGRARRGTACRALTTCGVGRRAHAGLDGCAGGGSESWG